MQEFTQLLKDLQEDVKDAVSGHSEFQIRHFIIGSCPTVYGQYKQCLLELRSRMKNYENLQKILGEIPEKTISDQEKAQKSSECELLIEDLKRETYILSNILQELKPQLDLTKKDELEAEYWDVKFHNELMLHVWLGYPVPVGLAQNIFTLPKESRSRKRLDEVLASKVQSVSIQGEPAKRLE
jgi:hypothetical protein